MSIYIDLIALLFDGEGKGHLIIRYFNVNFLQKLKILRFYCSSDNIRQSKQTLLGIIDQTLSHWNSLTKDI